MTGDTYMKLSWLTVTEKSMAKEHKCVVKHEFNERGTDQEIFFPSVNKVQEYLSSTLYETSTAKARIVTTTKGRQDILESTTQFYESEQETQINELFIDAMQQQLTSTSAYYAYLLLLLKSTIYFAIIASSLLRTTVC